MKRSENDDLLKLARTRFQEAEEYDRENRLEAVEDLKFKAGEQYPEKIRSERETDGRPCLTINKMPQFVRQVTGDVRQNKPSIKVRPVDDKADIKTAEIYNGVIRNIESCSQAASVYATAADNQVTCGFGAWRIVTEYSDDDTFEQDLRIEAIPNALSVYVDPMARKQDKSDARFIFVVARMAKEEFEAKYPDASLTGWDVDDAEIADWIGPETVRVAEYWVVKTEPKELALLSSGQVVDVADFGDGLVLWAAQNGVEVKRRRKVEARKVCQYITNGVEILEPMKEWAGPYIPIIPVVGEEVWVGERCVRHGLIRFAKDPQRLFNYMRSASAEWVALQPKAPFMVSVKQIAGFEDLWADSGKKNLPYLPYNPDPDSGMPQRAAPPQAAGGLITEANLAADDIKSVTGIYDASLGAQSNETSGVAIEARQREGDVSTFVYIDNLSAAIAYTGRQLVELIPKVYDTERVIRILGEDGATDSIKINIAVMGPDGKRRLVNDLSVGKYDVVVETGPGYTTKRREASQSMVDFIRAFPAAAPVMGDMLAKVQDWPYADEIAQRLQKLLPPGMNGEPVPQPPAPPVDQAKEASAALSYARAEGQNLDNMMKANQMGLAQPPSLQPTPGAMPGAPMDDQGEMPMDAMPEPAPGGFPG